MKRKRVRFIVSLIPPEKATVKDCRDYIQEAVSTWSGQCMPDHLDGGELVLGDPMFDLNGEDIKVTYLKEITPHDQSQKD